MKVTGIISEILPERSGISQTSGQPWTRFPFIFEFFDDDNKRYADRILLETWSTTDIELIRRAHENRLKVTMGIGHGVKRSNDGRVFNELKFYNMELVSGQEGVPQAAPSQAAVAQAPAQATAAPATEAPAQGAQPDKLPF